MQKFLQKYDLIKLNFDILIKVRTIFALNLTWAQIKLIF